jgi:hypothetical protein
LRKILILALLVCVSSCTSKSDADRALTAMGFTDIEVTGYSLFACSQDDFYHTGFTATNTNGKKVTGTVCSGFLFKNSTVRFS